MLGTIINTVAIIIGSLVGILVHGGVRNEFRQTVMQALSLAVILIGLKGALQTDHLLLVIGSLVVGSLVGEILKIEARLETLGKALEQRIARSSHSIAHGFVTASLVFCVGAMAIVGSLESGLTGNHQTLYAKSMLDGMAALIFASTMGIGVLFSAMSVFIYQGMITITSGFLQPLLTPDVISQMTSVGGLLIMAIGFNLLEYKRIKVGNMVPAIFVPLGYFAFRQMFGLG